MCRFLLLDTLVLTADGGFQRPGETKPLFPKGGVELKWRWDAAAFRIVIDFWKDEQLLDWRWDELSPSKELRFPSLVPDWTGVGHVGSRSFSYDMLSLDAENWHSDGESPRVEPKSPSDHLEGATTEAHDA
eukprot:symbB.v1.2.018428.t1/scaffold1470.1/size116919/11